MESSSTNLAPATVERPVDRGERLVLLDVLRGFAISGVFLIHVNAWFSGRSLQPPERWKATPPSAVEIVFNEARLWLVGGKFFTTLAFLFGLGFAVQLLRAEERKAPFMPLYTRRLTVLMLFGALNSVALWWGDILHVYALWGFALLLFRPCSSRALVVWGLVLGFLVPSLMPFAETVVPRLWMSQEAAEAARKAARAQMTDLEARALAGFSSDSYLAVVRSNIEFRWGLNLRPSTIAHFCDVLGRFLLGFVAGRHGLFQDVGKHRRVFRHLLGWGLLAGIVGFAIAFTLNALITRNLIVRGTPLTRVLFPLAREINFLGLSAFYVAAIALLFQRPRWRRLLGVLAPAGQMALTNYVAQGALGMLIFYGVGFGLIGDLRISLALAITTGVVALQVAWSHLWLWRFRFGPLEWVWRSLTYMKAQPMLRARADPPVPSASAT